MLRLTNLAVTFDDGRALRISEPISIEGGKALAVIGSNGSGKDTARN